MIPETMHPVCAHHPVSSLGHPLLTPSHVTLIDNAVAWQYGGGVLSPQSSLTLVAGSLASNQTYQLMVQMENRENSSDRAVGYVVVRVENKQSQLITIG